MDHSILRYTWGLGRGGPQSVYCDILGVQDGVDHSILRYTWGLGRGGPQYTVIYLGSRTGWPTVYCDILGVQDGVSHSIVTVIYLGSRTGWPTVSILRYTKFYLLILSQCGSTTNYLSR